ncbi:MAG: hypothetical protein ACE5FR_07765 [Rhodospirillales bacterium]
MNAMWLGMAAAVVIAIVVGIALGSVEMSSAEHFSSASARL